MQDYDLKKMTEKIAALRRSAEELKKISGGIPSVVKNADCILNCVKMLEIGISDAASVE